MASHDVLCITMRKGKHEGKFREKHLAGPPKHGERFFFYEALNSGGDRTVRGKVIASSSDKAIAKILAMGLLPISLREQGGLTRLMCLDNRTLCGPNGKPPHYCDGCGG